jgi:hypothetical protein
LTWLYNDIIGGTEEESYVDVANIALELMQSRVVLVVAVASADDDLFNVSTESSIREAYASGTSLSIAM